MTIQYKTVKEATELYVRELDAIQQDIIKKLIEADPRDWVEVTEPGVGDRVYTYDANGREASEGEVIKTPNECNGKYAVGLDDGETALMDRSDICVIYDDFLPMWSTMWSFHDSADDQWLDMDDGIRKMSECGFRIYKSEEFGYFFGIDGAGYDFYEAHWIPLYRARGLKWHDEDTEE